MTSAGKIALFILIATIVIITALAALATWLRRNGMFFPDRYPVGEWETSYLPIRPTDHWFETKGGAKLHGWLFKANAEAPVMIWFHGNAGNISHRGPASVEFAHRDINVFVFDYRGFGRSEGSANETHSLADSLAAYDYVVAKIESNPKKIVLYGESIGGPMAAWVAANRKARCVVIENSFPSLRRLAQTLYGRPLALFAGGALATAEWLNRGGLPVLVMHGKRDAVISYELGVELYRALEVPKEFLSSEKAGHSELAYVERDRFYDAIKRFVNGAAS